MSVRNRPVPKLTPKDQMLVTECREKGLHKKFEEIQRRVWTKGPADMDLQLLYFMSATEQIKVPAHVVEHWKSKCPGWVSFYRAYGVVMILVDDHLHDFVAANEFTATYETLRPRKAPAPVFPTRVRGSATSEQIFMQAKKGQVNSRLIT